MRKYIYIDTKIEGTIIQLISYFNTGVFNNEYIVIFKQYEENRKFLDLFDKADIKYKTFSIYKQFPDIEDSVVFYLFNAQSNCRIVAYREAKHVFVTHGESNKLPSVKPILRIYDHVITAGNGGVDRLIENNVFDECDLKRKKIIKMGNTFIGENNYYYDSSSKKLLYAPTWEGGLKNENYSSIDETLSSFKILAEYVKSYNIKEIILQFHPNMGHRDKRYLFYLVKGVNFLLKHNIKISVRKNFNNFFLDLFFKIKKINILKQEKKDFVRIAFCDVSAMETQLLDKNIPYYIFKNFNKSNAKIPSKNFLKEYYSLISIDLQTNPKDVKFNKIDKNLYKKVQNYYITYENEQLKNLNYNNRIKWLVEYINEQTNSKNKE